MAQRNSWFTELKDGDFPVRYVKLSDGNWKKNSGGIQKTLVVWGCGGVCWEMQPTMTDFLSKDRKLIPNCKNDGTVIRWIFGCPRFRQTCVSEEWFGAELNHPFFFAVWSMSFFPQQPELMGSSAQNSSGVQWCRRWVRFHEVPEKVWEALVQSQVTFNRVPEKLPERIPGGFGAEPGQVQRGSGEGSGEGLGGFGAAGQVQRGSGEGSEESSGEGFGEGSGRLWCSARSGSTGFRTRFRRRSGRLWCRARSGSTGFRRRFRRRFQEALVQSRVRFNGVRRRLQSRSRRRFWGSLVQGLASQHASERFLKIKRLRLLGIPPKLIGFFFRPLFAKNWGIFDKIGPIFLDKIKAFLPCNALCDEMGIWFGRKLSCPTCPFEASYQTQPGWHSGSISTKPTTEIVSTLEYSWIWHSAKTAAQNDELLRAAMFRAARSSSRQSSSVQLAILGLPRWALRGFGCESFPSGRLV